MSPAAASADAYRRRRRLRIVSLLVATDAVLVVVAGLLATLVRYGGLSSAAFGAGDMHVRYVMLSLLGGLMWPVFLHLEHLYDVKRLFRGSGEFTRVVRGVTSGTLALLVSTYFVKLPGLSRSWAMLSWILAVLLVSLGRSVIRMHLIRGHSKGRSTMPALIVGLNSESLRTIETLRSDTTSGFVAVGVLTSQTEHHECRDRLAQLGIPILGNARDLRRIVLEQPVVAVIIVASSFDKDAVARMIVELRDVPVDINVSAGLFDVVSRRLLVREVSGVPLISVRAVLFSRWSLFKKRAFDVGVSSCVLLAGAPLWLVIMALIKLDSPGPVFYKQARVGKMGVPFGMFKFRSMVDDADARLVQLEEDNEADGPLFKMRSDPRITRVGKWLRKFSLDEFPQLLNVLRGEMSLVGPRPPLIREAEQYGEQEWRRMEVLPGLTGLWQVSGRSNLTFDEMIKLDLYYIENWSIRLDLAIMLRTVPAVVFARGAY